MTVVGGWRTVAAPFATMKAVIPALAIVVSSARADLVITEVMPQSVHVATETNGDWWELTNTGADPVNLAGYKWDDTPTPLTPTVSVFPNFVIQPGESVIIVEEAAANIAAWKAAWGLSSTRVIDRDQFSATGGEGFSGLGTAGDEVNLYDAGGNLVAHVDFGASVPGVSQAWHPDGTPILGRNSAAGKHGATASQVSPADTGSPGNARSHFTSSPVRFAKSTYFYQVSAVRPGLAAPVISATSIPSFLTLTPGAAGSAVLAGNRALTLADAGEHLIQLAAGGTIQEFHLTVFNPRPSVILNEYNAVAALSFLNGGDLNADEDGAPASTDAFFGRVQGNGGQWVEFVVVPENGSSTTLDMRGWKIEIGTNTGSGFFARNTLVLSQNANWQAVPVGTILTFIDRNTAQGGRDSGFAIRDRRATLGDIWTNIWIGDTTHLDYTGPATNGYTLNAGVVGGIIIDNDATQFRVRNASGAVVFGPAGEGIAPLAGTNSKEVLELEGHPTSSVTPTDKSSATAFGYDDGASESTFGLPNNWLDGTTPRTQRFTTLSAPEISVTLGSTPLADGGGIDYGTISSGSSSISLTISNTGSADLTGIAASLAGTHSDEFSITTAPAATLAAPDGTTTLVVAFQPTSQGAKTATLRIASNDDDENPYDIILTGVSAPAVPEIAVRLSGGAEFSDGGSHAFGSAATGTTTPVIFSVLSKGTASLTGVSVSITGTNAADFKILSAPATTIAALDASDITIAFAPLTAGTKTAVLSIASNDGDENPFDITLGGTAFATQPEISVQQPARAELVDGTAKRTFGTVKTGKSGVAKTFVIRNIGNAPLTNLAVIKAGTHSRDFIVTQPPLKTLAPGTSTTFKVTFKPTAAGTRNASLRIRNNDANENPFDIKLSGLGAK